MRYETRTVRIGEDCGPVDWSHETAREMPPIWREAEKHPGNFVFTDFRRAIIKICMYDGWPYWQPRPAIFFYGPIGAEWNHFDSYGVGKNSIRPKDAP